MLEHTVGLVGPGLEIIRVTRKLLHHPGYSFFIIIKQNCAVAVFETVYFFALNLAAESVVNCVPEFVLMITKGDYDPLALHVVGVGDVVHNCIYRLQNLLIRHLDIPTDIVVRPPLF